MPSLGTVPNLDERSSGDAVTDRLATVLATWRAGHDERALRRALLALIADLD